MLIRRSTKVQEIYDKLPPNKQNVLSLMSLKLTSNGWMWINIISMIVGLLTLKYHGFSTACGFLQLFAVIMQCYQFFYLKPQLFEDKKQ